MKTVLFCKNPYAFGILLPLYNELEKQGHQTMWFIPTELMSKCPDAIKKARYCNNMAELMAFNADANFVPGNIIPHYLPGVKVQLFHGFASEKKGHFRIRHYFDLYLTQGPYFTVRFQKLAAKHKDFKVSETGWCKLDIQYKQKAPGEKGPYKKHLLYAPTFSPSLTSGEKYFDALKKLCENKDYLLSVKFHDLMNKEVVKRYLDLEKEMDNLVVSNEPNILPLMQKCDLMISDTSSVVYEFLLLNKPIVTLETTSTHIRWDDINETQDLSAVVERNLNEDPHQKDRQWFIDNYHPYTDGQSSARMITAVEEYIRDYGVPAERKLSFWRRRKVNKTFGKKP